MPELFELCVFQGRLLSLLDGAHKQVDLRGWSMKQHTTGEVEWGVGGESETSTRTRTRTHMHTKGDVQILYWCESI